MSIIPYINRPAPFALPPAMALLDNEREGMAIDFPSLQAYVRDRSVSENNFFGDVNDLLTYTDPSTKYVRNAAGIYEPGTTLRCDHDADGTPLGIRVEGQAINYVLNSGFTLGADGSLPTSWLQRGSVTAKRVAGGGSGKTASADCMRISAAAGGATGGSDDVRVGLNGFTSGQIYTVSFKAKLGPGSVGNKLRYLFSTQSDNITLTEEYQKFTAQATASGPSHGLYFGSGSSATDGVVADVTDVQVEPGSLATSYIPTGASAVTRAADDISFLPSQFPYSSTEGTLLLDMIMGNEDYGPWGPSFYYASEQYYGFARIGGTGWSFKWGTALGTTRTFDTNTGYAVGKRVKLIGTYAAGVRVAMAITGSPAVVDNGNLDPQVGAIPKFNFNRPGRDQNCYVRLIKYLPRHVSDNSELLGMVAL